MDNGLCPFVPAYLISVVHSSENRYKDSPFKEEEFCRAIPIMASYPEM